MIDRQRTTTVRTAVVTFVLALLAAGCSGNGGEDPGDAESTTSSPSSPSTSLPTDASSTPTSTPTGSGATGAPLAFDADATTTLTDSEVRDIALTSQFALTLNSEKLTARSVPGLAPAYEIPAESGPLVDLWVAPTGRDGLLVEAGSRPGEGTSAGVDTYAVRRFDVASGAVTGTATLEIRQDARSSSGTPAAAVSGIAGDLVVLDTWPSTGPSDDAFTIAASPHTTLALDLGAGELAWSAPDTRPVRVLDEVAVLSTGTPAKNGELRGLDVESGQERWSALAGTRSATVVGAVGEQLTLAVAQGSSSKAAVTTVDTGTGEVGESRPTPTWNWACHDTSTSIVLCSLLGTNRVVGWDLERGTESWSLPTRARFAPSISTVYADAAYGLVAGRGVVLDALTGADLASDTGAAPAAVSSAGGLSVLGGEAVFQPAAG